MGVEPITPTLQGSVAPNGMPARQLFERSVRESNPVSVLTTDVCSRNTYRPFLSSDPGWNRTSTLLHVTQASSPLDHGIVDSDRGGRRTHKFTRLSTSPLCLFAYPAVCFHSSPFTLHTSKWRVRGSHPVVQAYEARMSTGPPASLGCRGLGCRLLGFWQTTVGPRA